MFKFAVLLLAAIAGRAQQTGKLTFPSDNEDPKQIRAVVAELLKSVCPNQISLAEELACRPCPDFTSTPGNLAGANITGVLRGHFLSPKSDDVLLSMQGCALSWNYGGTALLTRESGDSWKMVRYMGLTTNTCHKVALSGGRDLLACVWGVYSRGIVATFLSVWDIASDPEIEDRLVTTNDDADTCGISWLYPTPHTSVTREYIERVSFHGGVSGPRTMTVIVQRGTKTITAEDQEACAKGSYKEDPSIAVKPRRITFNWDGKAFHQMPSQPLAGPR